MCGTEGHFRAVFLKSKQSNASTAADETHYYNYEKVEHESKFASSSLVFATHQFEKNLKELKAVSKRADVRLGLPPMPND